MKDKGCFKTDNMKPKASEWKEECRKWQKKEMDEKNPDEEKNNLTEGCIKKRVENKIGREEEWTKWRMNETNLKEENIWGRRRDG